MLVAEMKSTFVAMGTIREATTEILLRGLLLKGTTSQMLTVTLAEAPFGRSRNVTLLMR